MATVEKSARQRILDAALKVLKTEGVLALTQTRVAAAAGLRQSHLTYYFPRKTDLLAATLEASHAEKPRRVSSRADADPVEAVQSLMFDRNRMRFFLSVVAQASDRAENFARRLPPMRAAWPNSWRRSSAAPPTIPTSSPSSTCCAAWGFACCSRPTTSERRPSTWRPWLRALASGARAKRDFEPRRENR